MVKLVGVAVSQCENWGYAQIPLLLRGDRSLQDDLVDEILAGLHREWPRNVAFNGDQPSLSASGHPHWHSYAELIARSDLLTNHLEHQLSTGVVESAGAEISLRSATCVLLQRPHSSVAASVFARSYPDSVRAAREEAARCLLSSREMSEDTWYSLLSRSEQLSSSVRQRLVARLAHDADLLVRVLDRIVEEDLELAAQLRRHAEEHFDAVRTAEKK